ncbi:methylmalonyl-CoA mutase family protein [Aquimarina agarilytica]|uniref:methylmalonyl-CoA mutase family protein n=1 Tax=Aquimarina agarilytica TaxID=1087449 RepID=UPI001E52B554|nr:methylmalonyl-CoA mutase family protein [Aquimarina agarilytica]
MNDIIFERFAAISTKQWKQKIQYELQGLDYQKTLVKSSADGIPQLPFYSESELKYRSIADFPKKINTCIYITVNNEATANTKAVNAINSGFTNICFTIFNAELDMDILLQNISVSTFIIPHFLNIDSYKKIQANYPQVTVLSDPIGKITQTGNWYRNFNHDFEQLDLILNHSPSSLTINQSLFHDAGATPVQQLAYSLTQLKQYDHQISLKKCNTITYFVAVGTDFFIEIAKLKALRILTNSYFESQNITLNCLLFQQKSQRTIQLFDSDINHEISSIECQIGQCAGVDFITAYPENYLYFKEDIPIINAQNKLLIQNIKNSSIPINDAIYIEKLTQQLIDKTLVLFESIEQGGGFTNQLRKGIIQKKIKEKESAEQKAFNQQFTVTTPTTKKTPIHYPFLKTKGHSPFWKPIIKKRLTAPQEKPIWDKLYSNG